MQHTRYWNRAHTWSESLSPISWVIAPHFIFFEMPHYFSVCVCDDTCVSALIHSQVCNIPFYSFHIDFVLLLSKRHSWRLVSLAVFVLDSQFGCGCYEVPYFVIYLKKKQQNCQFCSVYTCGSTQIYISCHWNFHWMRVFYRYNSTTANNIFN